MSRLLNEREPPTSSQARAPCAASFVESVLLKACSLLLLEAGSQAIHLLLLPACSPARSIVCDGRNGDERAALLSAGRTASNKSVCSLWSLVFGQLRRIKNCWRRSRRGESGCKLESFSQALFGGSIFTAGCEEATSNVCIAPTLFLRYRARQLDEASQPTAFVRAV